MYTVTSQFPLSSDAADRHLSVSYQLHKLHYNSVLSPYMLTIIPNYSSWGCKLQLTRDSPSHRLLQQQTEVHLQKLLPHSFCTCSYQPLDTIGSTQDCNIPHSFVREGHRDHQLQTTNHRQPITENKSTG